MPKPKNTRFRILVPVIALAIGALIVYATLKNSTPTAVKPAVPAASPTPSPNTAVVPAATPAPGAEAAKTEQAAAVPAKQEAAPAPAPAAGFTLRARSFGAALSNNTVGSLEKDGTVRAQIDVADSGVGIRSLRLAKHFTTIEEKAHVELQAQHTISTSAGPETLIPFAALAVEVTPAGSAPQMVPLFGDKANSLWEPTKDGFVAVIEDEKGTEVLRIVRKFSIAADSGIFEVHQEIQNTSGLSMAVRWFQTGPVDLTADSASYGGDRRYFRVGYLLPESRDPGRTPVTLTSIDQPRANILGQRYSAMDTAGATFYAYREWQLWPTPETQQAGLEPSWLAFNNRYYGVAVHPLFDATQTTAAKPLAWLGQVDRIVLDGGDGAQIIGLRLSSNPSLLAPGARVDLSHGIFAGPLSRKEIAAEPVLKSLRLKNIVVYNFGGPCGWCTFDSITGLLLWVLQSMHAYIFKDWALSIVFLVVVVRGTLHPLTRWTQIKMGRFAKQMSAIQPKQKIIQEKYGNDPAKLQQETAKLWREEGISPAGFLGCLPAFFQTPVWIALSAMLFFAVELRHEHAFYGIVQSLVSKGSTFWYFLGDLAEPDRFIYFGRTIFNAPLLGPIDSFNLLPLILGVMYYLQQTYFNPQPTATQTPEQEMQMKIMKYMTIIMFPALMYNAPAGLSLYFAVNTTLAILESKWIRSYMEKHDMLNVDKMRAERQARAAAKGGSTSQGGIMAALERYAREKQGQTEKRFGQDKPKK
jgi:YidC/Oxa1 family membrane protein insertase